MIAALYFYFIFYIHVRELPRDLDLVVSARRISRRYYYATLINLCDKETLAIMRGQAQAALALDPCACASLLSRELEMADWSTRTEPTTCIRRPACNG